MTNNWASEVNYQTLVLRNNLLRDLRAFFAQRSVLEVNTPTLGIAGVSDVHLASLTVSLGSHLGYLQTSPEHAMKRLLADGSGPIYQICPAYRAGEFGDRHNIEFTMLEWYQPGYSMDDLIAEVGELLKNICDLEFEVISYEDVFELHCGINPHMSPVKDLVRLAGERKINATHLEDVDDSDADYLDLLFSALVQPHLEAAVVVDFPECQAALANHGVNTSGETVARRFELFLDGVEIANGYDELRDGNEIRERFEKNNAIRKRRNLPVVPLDEQAVAAMSNMDPCAGVALGVDRLLMHLGGLTEISKVINFARDHWPGIK